MTKPRLAGVIAASVTPVTAGGEIDVARLARHIGRLHADGCDYVSTFGTTGEGASLGSAQKAAALHELAEAGIDMARQLPSVMTPTVADAALSLRTAGLLGCRAALVLPPFYYPFWTDAGIVDFFAAATEIAERDAPPVDLVLYNIPQFSGVPYSPDLVAMMIDRFGDRVIGMKDSTGDLDNGIMLAKTFPALSIFTGDDRVLPHLLRAGGAGIIGGMPNLFAADLRRIVADPDSAEAAEASEKSARRIEVLDGNGGLAAIKAALAIYGDDPGLSQVMPPLRALDDATARRVVAMVDETGFAYAHGE
ncbi:dihydrodipicolinate synthase family protein [Oceaniglobus indicus]|uniref:dihydrodipicolinate synthase family protein n=1 Tax=Oceaniglobus indicus TaxID=2047749 RepID=UPI000C197EE9|nr:dihydrodipicolinate synthase family protein [Oceaniglobus indicus]